MAPAADRVHVFIAREGDRGKGLLVVHLLPGVASASLLAFVRRNKPGRERALRAAPKPTLRGQRRWYERWWEEWGDETRDRIRCIALYGAGPLLAALPQSVRAVALVRDPIDLVLRLAETHDVPLTVPDAGEELPWSAWANPQARALLAGHVEDVDRIPTDPDHPDAQGWRRRLATVVAQRYVLGVRERMEDAILRFAHEAGWSMAVTPRLREANAMPIDLDTALARAIARACWLDRELVADAAAGVDDFTFGELPRRLRAQEQGTIAKVKQRELDPGMSVGPRYRLPKAEPGPEDLHERVRRAEARADWSAARSAVLASQIGASDSSNGARAFETTQAPDRKVMHGRDGWLFLANDSRHIEHQLTGRLTLRDEEIAEWLAILRRRRAATGSIGAFYVFAVAPVTHHLFEEFLPPGFELVAPRPVEQLLAAIAPGNEALPPVVYPLDVLRAEARHRNPGCQVDSHWNEWGAFLAYREILAALPEEVLVRRLQRDDLALREAVAVGDLGVMVLPPMRAPTVVADIRDSSIEVVEDNRVHNDGRIVRFHNAAAPDARCVLFGSSSAQVGLKFFAASFRTLVYAFNRAGFDAAFAREEAADVAISLLNERYLIWPPDEGAAAGIHDVARARYQDGLVESEESAIKLYADWATPRAGCFAPPS